MKTIKLKSGSITLQDAETAHGWTIETADDILLALEAVPYFGTTAAGFIADAIEQAAGDRETFKDVNDLAQHIAENYI